MKTRSQARKDLSAVNIPISKSRGRGRPKKTSIKEDVNIPISKSRGRGRPKNTSIKEDVNIPISKSRERGRPKKTPIKEYSLSSISPGNWRSWEVPGQTFYVETLLGMKTTQQGRMFLVKWMGYPPDKATWEQQKNIPEIFINRYKNHFKDCNDRAESLKIESHIPREVEPSNSDVQRKERACRRKVKFEKPKPKVQESRFPRGWIAEKVLGTTLINNTQNFIIQFKNKQEVLFSSLAYCKRRIPQLVIEFFQKHLTS